jgi:hypothetical protein
LIHVEGLWVFVGPAPIRLSTILTFLLVFVFVAWRFRVTRWLTALYNGVVAALFTLFLYEVLFNVTGGFPPTDMLPFWGVGLLVCSILLGLLQAKNHFVPGRLSIVLLSVFIVDWLLWVLVGFPFNLPSTEPLNLVAEFFNVSTKLLLPFGYGTALSVNTDSRARLRNPG